MNTIDAIKNTVATVGGIVFRKPLPCDELDAIRRFAFGDEGMGSAITEFDSLCTQFALLGQQTKFDDTCGRDATYVIDGIIVRATVTGGMYSAPLLGVSAKFAQLPDQMINGRLHRHDDDHKCWVEVK